MQTIFLVICKFHIMSINYFTKMSLNEVENKNKNNNKKKM